LNNAFVQRQAARAEPIRAVRTRGGESENCGQGMDEKSPEI
jgi:hypothetical protein